MKKYISYILMGVAVLCTGCDNFFSNESPSAMDVTVFHSPAPVIEQTIAGIYVILGEQNAYRTRLGGYWVMPGTDCEMAASGAPDYEIYTMTKAGHSDLIAKDKHPWIYLTMAIERANVIVAGMEQFSDTVTDDDIRYLYGEVLTLRAWLTYEMTKLWGDIPYMFEPVDASNMDSFYPAKVDRNIVYDKLRQDLRHAANLMPNSAECPRTAKRTVERCNREFALGLLARIDLVYAGKAMRPDEMVEGSAYKVQFNTTPEKRKELLEEVIWACDEVIKADGDLKFMNNYEDIFKAVSSSVTDYMSTESLFEIPFADGVRGQFMKLMGAYVNKTAIAQAKLKGLTDKAKSNAKIVATPSFLYSFEKGDKRKWVTVSPGEWNYDSSSKIPGVEGDVLYQKTEKISKMYLGKYRHEWMKFAMDNDEDGINIPQMRYTDVLLMYAEAAIGSVSEVTPSNADLTKAQQYFNKVRARAGLGSKPLTMENLMQERAWEFTGEFIRKYDLMRWGVFAEKLWEAQEHMNNFTKVDENGLDYSGTPYEGQLPTKNIYVKYVEDRTLTQDGSPAYRIDQIYGMELGESGKPADYDEGGWVEKEAYTSSNAAAISVKHGGNRIFGAAITDKQLLDARQYWPIFNVITSANHNLYNDYGY